ncbi:nucleotide exchange factor GrpE [Paenibacillus albus]|uniref:Protein GrpE n=1 Tax=Paenibacillus albus TaxID=2495582 RepID=A0A3S9A3X6_9BACL|nr:nucleotide exchange factor GrpE [Paenibacillus albus]AZN40431.1 nucleotide exchange factor GrpE [Paenibacillus albus]
MSVNEQHTDEEHINEVNNATVEEQEVPTEETASNVEEGSAEDSRIAELTKLADENQQRYLRAQADFDNFRRRTMKEKEDLAQYASMKLISQLLPVVDNFGRAVEAAKSGGDVESFAKGVDMIFRQFEQVLEAEGLKAMEVVGEPFNPDFHQAIMQVESDEHEEGIVVEEVQKGYVLKDKVLRPAMVKVSG